MWEEEYRGVVRWGMLVCRSRIELKGDGPREPEKVRDYHRLTAPSLSGKISTWW